MKNGKTSGQHGPKHEGGAYHQLLPYQKARRDMQELVTIKANIDTLMGYTEPGRKQEKER